VLALPLCVSVCLPIQVPETIFPTTDGSQNYAIWVGGAPISQNEATFSQPHGAISSDFGEERAFLESRKI